MIGRQFFKMVEKQIVKIDDNNVAIVSEARSIHEKSQLQNQKTQLTARIAEINELLDALE